MEFSFDPSTLNQTLLIAAKGILGTFLVIAAVMFVIFLLNTITKKRSKKE